MIQTQLSNTMAASVETHDFSGVITIRQKENVLYEGAFGYANRSNRIANTLATRFGIASGTKFFTALAIGKLIEAQKLSFSTLLKDCLALNFAHYSQDITIQHLLTHTSGIPDYLDEDSITDFDNIHLSIPWYALKSPRDYLAVFPDQPMKFAPGQGFSYSNGGYILLGVVIEELTGMRYQDFVEQEIFKPIGMDQSGYFVSNKLPEKTALGYIMEADGGWRTNVFNLPIIGASDGGAFTTVGDVATLWKSFWTYEILPKALVDIYSQAYVKAEPAGEHIYYGHGLWMREHDSRTYFLVGGDAGVSFKSLVDRAAELEVTVISNSSHGAWPVLKDIDGALRGGGIL